MNKLQIYGLTLLALVLAFAGWSAHERSVGARDFLIRSKDSTIVVLTKRLDSAHTHFRVDTVRLTTKLTRYDTVRKELDLHDTVTVIRFVNAADSTIKACRDVFDSCKVALAASQDVIREQNTEIGLLKKSQPSALGMAAKLGIAVGVGVLAGRLLH